MKVIAIILSCLQLFACASDGYRITIGASDFSKSYSLKAVGRYTKLFKGEVFAISDSLELPIKIKYVKTDVAGLVFVFIAANHSRHNIEVSTEDIFCQPRKAIYSKNNYRILSASELLAYYDHQIHGINRGTSSSKFDAGATIGMMVFILVLVVIIVRSGSNLNLNYFPSFNKSGSTAHSKTKGSEKKLSNKSSAVETKVVARKQQQQSLLKSSMLNPGDTISGQIICPLKAMGKNGINLVYREELFEFAKPN